MPLSILDSDGLSIFEGRRFWLNHFFSFDSGHDDCHIFIATRKCKVTAVRFIRSADEYGDLAVVVTRTQGTEAPASGDTIVASTDLDDLVKDTVTSGTVITASAVNELAIGNRVSLNFTGTPYAGIWLITIEMELM